MGEGDTLMDVLPQFFNPNKLCITELPPPLATTVIAKLKYEFPRVNTLN